VHVCVCYNLMDGLPELSHEFARHARMLHAVRAHLSRVTLGVDTAAFPVLMFLGKAGPQRQADLAGCLLLDQSTVSRYAARLVAAGLVHREPDPLDGRAARLALTPSGEQALATISAHRDELIATVVRDWSPGDVATFTRLLRRYNDAFEASRAHLTGGPAGPERT
jgi:DNA-binding MarR family transcriptional regulator